MVDKPGLCNLEFAMGAHGLVWKPSPVEGPPEVERVSCQARLLGVKPGWTIHLINGVPIEKSSQAWGELLKCKKSGQKYSVYFVKDEASIQADKQKMEADKAKKAKEQEDRRKREEKEKQIREEAEKKREDEKKSRKEAYAEKQEAAAASEAAPAEAASAAWNFGNAKITFCNIGDQVPEGDPKPCLIIGECLPGVNIRVEVVSDGFKGDPDKNMVVPGQGHTRVQVAIGSETANNSMDVKFTFVKADSGEEVPMSKIQMAVHDIDAEEKLTVESAALESKAASEEAKLQEEEADGKTSFAATEAANKEALDETRKLELNFAGKSSFQVNFSSKGGNFMFSFPSVAP